MQNTLDRYITHFVKQKRKFKKNDLALIKFELIKHLNRGCCTTLPNTPATCCSYFRTGDITFLLYLISLSNVKQLKEAQKTLRKLMHEDPCCINVSDGDDDN